MLFLCLYDVVSKGTPQGYYAKLRHLGGGKDRNRPPQKRHFMMFLRRYIAVFLYLQM